MSNVRNADWDIMSNGKKCQLEIMQNVRNAKWDIMLNGKKKSTGNNVESNQYRICLIVNSVN